MKDKDKTKEQMINELEEMRQRVAELETSEDERKRAEETLRESRDFLDRILNGMFDGVMVIDSNYRIVEVNNCFLKYYGKTRQEIIGHTCYEITHLRSQPCAEVECPCPLQTVVKTSLPLKLEHTHKDQEGKDLIIEIYSFPLFGPTGEVEYVVEIQHDITERKQAEEKLRESMERFRALTESTSDWIWEVDANGVYTYASPKVKDLLGYEPEEVIGKTPFDLMLPEDVKRIAEEFRAIVESHSPITRLENTNLHKDGHLVVLETSGAPFFDADGQLRGYRGIDRDITERKRAEEKIRESEEKLRSIVENSSDQIFMLDKDCKFLSINKTGAWLEHTLSPLDGARH